MSEKEITLSEEQEAAIRSYCLNPDSAKAILEDCQDEFPCEDGDFKSWGKAIASYIFTLGTILDSKVIGE